MKYIKLYENVPTLPNKHPDEGDYVICKGIGYSMKYDTNLKDFIDTHIGQIIGISINTDPVDGVDYYSLEIEYDENEIPENLKPRFRFNTLDFTYNDILDWSSHKEELEIRVAAKKYNL